jgi:hypothetical protein
MPATSSQHNLTSSVTSSIETFFSMPIASASNSAVNLAFASANPTGRDFTPCSPQRRAFDDRLLLHRVQVPPLPQLMIVDRGLSIADRAGNGNGTVEVDRDVNVPFFQLRPYLAHYPWRGNPKHLPLQFEVSRWEP